MDTEGSTFKADEMQPSPNVNNGRGNGAGPLMLETGAPHLDTGGTGLLDALGNASQAARTPMTPHRPPPSPQVGAVPQQTVLTTGKHDWCAWTCTQYGTWLEGCVQSVASTKTP